MNTIASSWPIKKKPHLCLFQVSKRLRKTYTSIMFLAREQHKIK